jgi:hypothetical protein
MWKRLFAWSCLCLSVLLLTWTFWPNPRQHVSLTTTIPWADAGDVQIQLETPTYLRLGETDKITLSLAFSTDEAFWKDGNPLVGASLELSGFRLQPSVTPLRPLPPSQSLAFTWQVTSEQVGSFGGVAPLKLSIYPVNGGPAKEYLLSAQSFQIDVGALLGLSLTWLRLLSGSGCVLSILLVLIFSIRKV